jgi:hypothetical protein
MHGSIPPLLLRLLGVARSQAKGQLHLYSSLKELQTDPRCMVRDRLLDIRCLAKLINGGGGSAAQMVRGFVTHSQKMF